MNTHRFRPFRAALRAALLLAAGLFAHGQSLAQETGAADCGLARDPARCEAHQAALAACADQRGKAKTACLAEHMPPVDCGKASNPANCAAAERAKQACGGKQGKALKACLRDAGGDTVERKAVKKKKAAGSQKTSKKAKTRAAAKRMPSR